MGCQTQAQISTYFSPDDNTQEIFLDFIRKTKNHLRIAIYSFDLKNLTDDLIQLHQSGVDVALICDHSQAQESYERTEIDKLRAANIPLVEGTSQKHKIMHHKFAVRDQIDVESGSWNYTYSASDESNYFDIITSPERAKLFLSKWQEIWDWITKNEPSY
ncbi:phosphatidylserine/phosphatidylglycerophosphate/cardiolipin synthase-like enzyme [Scopulibacillus daqui]|uniref:phospholipase D n=1 Tax=Scopulibacillus daqui TaxID=1469162 RepID=A0ABS2PWI8_9BACL|nr:phospholipase D-like domain-containing protein [Scopulibacillus daqui]MBM7644080.1 phosphatidylserine/phosphatidylglycerophosphate/cardiolipin synthase-like enzyme [Scopulibacillus daqui]